METLEEWFSPQGVKDRYGFSISTLAKWRMERINLPFHKMGKYIRYKRSEIEKYIESNLVEVV